MKNYYNMKKIINKINSSNQVEIWRRMEIPKWHFCGNASLNYSKFIKH